MILVVGNCPGGDVAERRGRCRTGKEPISARDVSLPGLRDDLDDCRVVFGLRRGSLLELEIAESRRELGPLENDLTDGAEFFSHWSSSIVSIG